MKKLLLLAALAALTINASADVSVTLPVPVTVETTTVSTTTNPVIDQIIIDLHERKIAVSLRGVDERIVVTGEVYEAVLAPNLGTLVSAVQTALTAALTPTPSPSP